MTELREWTMIMFRVFLFNSDPLSHKSVGENLDMSQNDTRIKQKCLVY